MARRRAPASEEPVIWAITGPHHGRWRAGRYFGRAPVRLDPQTLSAAERALIQGDAQLSVAIEPGAPAEAAPDHPPDGD